LDYPLKTSGLPFVMIEVGEHQLVMLLDTGANCCLLSPKTCELLAGKVKSVKGMCQTMGLEGKMQEQSLVKLSFLLCGRRFNAHFQVLPDQNGLDKRDNGIPFEVNGILGCDFLLENGMIIDLERAVLVMRGK